MSELIEALLFSKEAYEKATNKTAMVFYCSEHIRELIHNICGYIVDFGEQVCILFGCRVIVDTRLNEYDGYSWR